MSYVYVYVHTFYIDISPEKIRLCDFEMSCVYMYVHTFYIDTSILYCDRYLTGENPSLRCRDWYLRQLVPLSFRAYTLMWVYKYVFR